MKNDKAKLEARKAELNLEFNKLAAQFGFLKFHQQLLQKQAAEVETKMLELNLEAAETINQMKDQDDENK